jgi:hypothetical protein
LFLKELPAKSRVSTAARLREDVASGGSGYDDFFVIHPQVHSFCALRWWRILQYDVHAVTPDRASADPMMPPELSHAGRRDWIRYSTLPR